MPKIHDRQALDLQYRYACHCHKNERLVSNQILHTGECDTRFLRENDLTVQEKDLRLYNAYKYENHYETQLLSGYHGYDMESILDVLQLYVCQEICKIPANLTEDEKKQFCRNCRFDDLIDQIIEEHEK